MRTYKNLKKSEKELLQHFNQVRTLFAIKQWITVFITFMFLALSIFLLSVNSLGAFIFGLYSILITIFLLVFCILMITNDQKYLSLVFEMEDTEKDLFQITQEDKNNLKRRWIKVK